MRCLLTLKPALGRLLIRSNNGGLLTQNYAPDMELFLSIVVPTYNRADLLKVTLQSLLVQSYPYFEILVVDDGGSDHTEEMILELNDPRITYYWKENAERGAARNYGAKLAKGGYLNFFDRSEESVV